MLVTSSDKRSLVLDYPEMIRMKTSGRDLIRVAIASGLIYEMLNGAFDQGHSWPTLRLFCQAFSRHPVVFLL